MSKPMGKRSDKQREKPEFDQYILDLSRVTRVTKGGKQMNFRACVILGDHHGRVGFGLAKGKDVQLGVEKAVHQAKKRMIMVPIVKETIPHAIVYKFKAATVFLKPAPRGSGIIAGGAMRAMLELAGVPNVSAKILGKTKNKVTIVKAAFNALQMFKKMPKKEVEAKEPLVAPSTLEIKS
jgi:small subunit ribosomal protein S5